MHIFKRLFDFNPNSIGVWIRKKHSTREVEINIDADAPEMLIAIEKDDLKKDDKAVFLLLEYSLS